jgi:EAL domain-containing protein (putative c-di-GMP-specific phosphodiesterase class I)
MYHPWHKKIIEVLAKPIIIANNVLYVTSSIGISLFPEDGILAQNLLKYADSAMYKAKNEGRNNFQFYSAEMTELAFERVVMETSLRTALKNEDLVVYYQPQVNGKTGQIIGMEALVRWQHSIMGVVSPSKFIPLAESTGLIIELDQLVMKTAMKQIVKWYEQGLNPGVLSLNLAIKQLNQKNCVDILEEIIKETKCKTQWLEFEITEGQIMINPQEAIQTLQQIANMGIELAIDDFGTGYSSLSYLKKFPINKLKIDKSFVDGLPCDEDDSGITKAIISLAKSLNLKVIAEGVETQEQKDFLVQNGCENIQGYFYAKPMPCDEMEIFLRNILVYDRI